MVAGQNITYTVTVDEQRPERRIDSDGHQSGRGQRQPFVSASAVTGSGWMTSAPAVGATGNVVFSKASIAEHRKVSIFQIVVKVRRLDIQAERFT